MRRYIDAVKRLTEDVVPFRPRSEPLVHTAPPAGEVVPFPTSEQEPQRFRMIVQSATTRPGMQPQVRMVDDLDHLNAKEVATQLHNYNPIKKQDNMWMSAPSVSGDSETRFFVHVLVGQQAARQPDMAEIEAHLPH